MPKSIGKKLPSTLAAVIIVIGATLVGKAASAEGDLYFMHNGSPYFVWSELSRCEVDLTPGGNPCVSWGSIPFCGRLLWGSPTSTSVAGGKLERNDVVNLRHTNGNTEFCKLES
ncbi:hypothetical protein [Pseudophaeobacter sp. EL27]|uniref:hypothetical protein n=1 Tax=Pseudophaeobacter sp. EL27 TaxID=2107580 RepID=UPI000EFBA45C|nr:hypothetical protein [Pseudophaeobacter sp. EL27]